MESKSRAKAVGFFVLAMIVMLIITVLWFSRDREPKDVFDIITDRSAEGIVPQAAVELYGLNVGRVDSVSFVENKPGYIRIRLLIEKNAPINQSTFATISSRGVTGVPFIALSDDDKMPTKARETLLTSITPAGEAPVIPLHLSILTTFTEGIAQFSDKAELLLTRVNDILTEENNQKLLTAIENIGKAADEFAQLSHTLNNDLMGEVKTVSQQATVTLKNLDSVLINANALVTDVRKPDGALQAITDSGQALVQVTNRLQYSTLPQVEAAARSFSGTMKTTDNFVEKLNEQPNMLIFGVGESVPGPGEAGYQSPYQK